MQKFEIKGNTYNVGFSFLAIREFEDMAKKSISQITNTWDNLLFFYCTIKALNKDFTTDLDTFVSWLDENPQLLIDFQYINVLNDDDPRNQAPENEVKKKWTTSQIFGLWTLTALLLVSPVLVPIISGIALPFVSLWLLVKLIKKIGKKRK